MIFSFTINGRPVNPFSNSNNQNANSNSYQNARNVNQYQQEYIRRYGYPRTCIDKMKMKEYEKAMREITIIDDVEIIDPSKKKQIEEEKNIDTSNKDSEVVITNNISGNQV